MSILNEKGYDIRFSSGLVVVGNDRHVLVKGEKINDIYCVFYSVNNITISSYALESQSIDHYIWHLEGLDTLRKVKCLE